MEWDKIILLIAGVLLVIVLPIGASTAICGSKEPQGEGGVMDHAVWWCPNCKRTVKIKMAPYCNHRFCNCVGPKIIKRCLHCGVEVTPR